MGSLNSAALPGIIAELSAAYYIRVGFVQIYRSKNIVSLQRILTVTELHVSCLG